MKAGPIERRVLSKQATRTYAGQTLSPTKEWYAPHASRMREAARQAAEDYVNGTNFRKKGNAELRRLLRHYLDG